VTLQPQYSLLAREIEWEIVPAAIDASLRLEPCRLPETLDHGGGGMNPDDNSGEPTA